MPVNGRSVEIQTSHETAVDYLRSDLGLTGTKLVCGSGVCGACTIAVDGVPVASCVLPIDDLEDSDVVTVEGIAEEGRLHPVQAAFLAHDGLQCGYCTPGFIVEAVAFFDRWRAEHGVTEPDRETVARALAGHLCRCGAYEGIFRAVAAACAGEFDQHREVESARPDGPEKVTGAAKYTTDVHLDAAVGRIVRAKIPHGELLGIEPYEALTLEGVLAFLPLAQPGDRIRYYGQPLAAVAAVDEETARRAVESVEVSVRPLRHAVGLRQCLSEEAPDVHGWWIPPSNNEAPTFPTPRRKNLVGPTAPGRINPFPVRHRLEKAEAEDRLIRGEWETAVVSHTAFEPHAAVAEWTSEGEVVVHLSTQGVHPNRRKLADALRVEEAQVRILADYVGGAFGAKQSLGTEAVAAAELARLANQPVRVSFDRIEELTVGGSRPGTRMELAAALGTDGKLNALRMKAIGDGGASVGNLVASFLPRVLYPGAPRTLMDYDAVSNAPPAAPFRAPGGPPALFALEAAVDELAERRGLDPVGLRRAWNDRPLRESVYDRVEANPRWANRVAPGNERFRTGVGVAFGSWFHASDDRVRVAVEAGPDGLRVESGAQDMGNGTRAMLASAVSDVFGVPPVEVEVVIGDSGLGRGLMSSASRTTPSLWPAAQAAARQALRSLLEQLPALGMEGASPVPGGVEHAGEALAWAELLPRLQPVSATAGRPADRRRLLPVPARIVGLQFGFGLTESAHVVEARVDTLLGRVQVVAVDTVLAAGTIHSPPAARSQVFGGVIQGIGMALHEERKIDRMTGAVMSVNLEDYRLTGIGDAPEMTVDFIEEGFEHVAGGGTGLSELAIVAVPAAVAAAVAHAVGHRFQRLPIRPADVVKAVS